MNETFRTIWTTVRVYVILTVILGAVYPVVIFGIGRLLPNKADGSWLARSDGTTAGSTLIAQTVTKPGFFYPRPSAAGDNGYDAMSSSASNSSPYAPDLQQLLTHRRNEVAAREHVAPPAVPVDAITASGSGLDPHISTAYARIQIPRVAAERHVDESTISDLVERCEELTLSGSRDGAQVNVVKLNFELSQL